MGGALWRVDVPSTRRCPCERGCGPGAGIVPTELCSARWRSWMLRSSDAFSQSQGNAMPLVNASSAQRVILRMTRSERDRGCSSIDANELRFVVVHHSAIFWGCARCRALWAPAECALRRPCRRTEGVPCGTDVMMSTYACAIPASTIFEWSTGCRPSR